MPCTRSCLWVLLSFVISSITNCKTKAFLWVLWAALVDKPNTEGVNGTHLHSWSIRRPGHLYLRSRLSCGVKPSTWGIWCYLQADGVRAEPNPDCLRVQTLCCRHAFTCLPCYDCLLCRKIIDDQWGVAEKNPGVNEGCLQQWPRKEPVWRKYQPGDVVFPSVNPTFFTSLGTYD